VLPDLYPVDRSALETIEALRAGNHARTVRHPEEERPLTVTSSRAHVLTSSRAHVLTSSRPHMSPNRNGPPTPKDGGPSPHRLPGARGLTPSVLLPAAAARTDPSAVGRRGAPASIPKRPGRTARFTGASAASRIASRSDPSHGTPRRYVGVDEARELASPARVGVRTRIVKRLSP
jgi:hypothetical protein